jgi:hypothetical protein
VWKQKKWISKTHHHTPKSNKMVWKPKKVQQPMPTPRARTYHHQARNEGGENPIHWTLNHKPLPKVNR